MTHQEAVQLEYEYPDAPEVFCRDCAQHHATLRIDDGTPLCEPCVGQRRIFIEDLRARRLGTVELYNCELVEVEFCAEEVTCG